MGIVVHSSRKIPYVPQIPRLGLCVRVQENTFLGGLGAVLLRLWVMLHFLGRFLPQFGIILYRKLSIG